MPPKSSRLRGGGGGETCKRANILQCESTCTSRDPWKPGTERQAKRAPIKSFVLNVLQVMNWHVIWGSKPCSWSVQYSRQVGLLIFTNPVGAAALRRHIITKRNLLSECGKFIGTRDALFGVMFGLRNGTLARREMFRAVVLCGLACWVLFTTPI